MTRRKSIRKRIEELRDECAELRKLTFDIKIKNLKLFLVNIVQKVAKDKKEIRDDYFELHRIRKELEYMEMEYNLRERLMAL
jgi:hypothetical protein